MVATDGRPSGPEPELGQHARGPGSGRVVQLTWRPQATEELIDVVRDLNQI